MVGCRCERRGDRSKSFTLLPPSFSSEQNRKGTKDAKRGEMGDALCERDDVGENVECKEHPPSSDRSRVANPIVWESTVMLCERGGERVDQDVLD